MLLWGHVACTEQRMPPGILPEFRGACLFADAQVLNRRPGIGWSLLQPFSASRARIRVHACWHSVPPSTWGCADGGRGQTTASQDKIRCRAAVLRGGAYHNE